MDTTSASDYRPTIIGRVARVILPLLQFMLPASAYKHTYNSLYKFYKSLLRVTYQYHVVRAHLSGDEKKILKAQMTKHLLPFTMGGHKALENAFEVISLAEEREIPGAIIECGVAEGGTAAMMALTNKKVGPVKRMKWFFDSFEGLPEPTADDYKKGKTGDFIRPLEKGSCLGTLDQVSDLLFNTLECDPTEIHLIKGWFQVTVPAHRERIGEIAVLRLDGDWYESTKIPLDNFYNQIVPGGFVIIDDYATCYGSRRAVDEFRAKSEIHSPLIPDGRGGVWFEKPF